ncbi:hypothetical protein [Nitrosopumilus sp.]|uniref:hypothetical protein n=1 Tax=Nitrosopumilus sp. TaxID=2024843 RepID=UPI003B5A003B
MQTSKEHDFLVKRLIDQFLKKGLKVSLANYPNYGKPMKIKRHSPDVLAIDKKNGLVYIGLTKTCDELSDQITKEQFTDFSRRLSKTQTSEKIRIPFYICVPENCKSRVKESFEEFGIPWKESIVVIGLQK